jgi:hypothetical protein
MHRRANALASLLGFKQAAGTSPGKWVVSDTAHPAFGEAVPAEVCGVDDEFVSRGSTALVRIDNTWVTAELVSEDNKEFEEWKTKKASGPGRDIRLVETKFDGRGCRHLPENEALNLYKNTVIQHWPMRGPRVVTEFLESLRSAGLALISHHLEWVRRSDVGPGSAVVREHFHVTESLRWYGQFDQVDLSNCAGAEMQVRRLVQIETAVRRNAKVPDFTGLDCMLDARTDSSGAAVTATFDSWVTDRQKDMANIQKQGRLLREEAANAKKFTAEVGGKGGGKQKVDSGEQRG